MRTAARGAEKVRRGPVAVVSSGPSAAAPMLRRLLGTPVAVLDPYDIAMGRVKKKDYQAVLVENFHPQGSPEGLDGCAAARWALPGAARTVVSLDDSAGRRLASQLGDRAFAYSDGRNEADLTAKNVNLRWGRLEFEALTNGDIARVRMPEGGKADLYAPLAALACALALGMPLPEAVGRLSAAEG